MFRRLALALLTPLLLWLGWPENGFTPLLFVAFLPLLFLERELSLSGEKKIGRKWFWYCWLAFGTWNLLGTWWLVNAHWSGLATTMLLNGVLMTLVMVIFRFIKKRLGNQRAYISIPFVWICFETLHKDWDFSFPWLTLGNGLAERVEWIQWYEYTGVFGGTLWIWTVNLLLFWVISAYLKHRQLKPFIGQSTVVVALSVGLPIFLSYLRYLNYEDQGTEVDIIAVQPNLDAYSEKFELTEMEQVEKFARLASTVLDDSVDFLIGPETMLPDGTYESQLQHTPSINLLQYFTRQYPNLNIVVGASTLKFYKDNPPASARELRNGTGYYDAFNTGLFISQADSIHIYHKSKLVVGVEMMPLSWIIKPLLGDIVKDFGGISGTLGTQQKREVFSTVDGTYVAAPLICWESDFAEYTTGYVREGANLLFVITNDDWWGNTPGHVQHMHYSRLRAIENRRSVARSANTGISCFINQRGDVFQRQDYKKDAVIRSKLKANNQQTYYSKVGDLLSRLSLFMGGFFVLYSLVYGFLRGKNQ